MVHCTSVKHFSQVHQSTFKITNSFHISSRCVYTGMGESILHLPSFSGGRSLYFVVQKTLLLLSVELSVVENAALPSHFLLCGSGCLRNGTGLINMGKRWILMSVSEPDFLYQKVMGRMGWKWEGICTFWLQTLRGKS